MVRRLVNHVLNKKSMSVRSLRKRKDSEEVEYPAYGITGTISL
jgi:hypothetical protein